MKNYESAIESLTILLHYEPENVKALYLRGKSYFAVREYEPSLNDFRIAKELQPQESDLFD
jgi:tetratricopeptide (TPR) repeat protein